jgi:homoserine kinase
MRVRVFAPATVSNLGPGFDVLGLALERPGDIVEAERAERPGVDLVEVTGDQGLLSRDPARNAAAVAAEAALRRLEEKTGQRGLGVRLWLHKGMPLASGLGSSGASSAAAAAAVASLWEGALDRLELVRAAMEGERATCGAAHADNVAPSLLGGIVLVVSYEPLDLVPLPVPPSLRIAVVRPHTAVATGEARALVAGRRVALEDVVANLGRLAALVAALYRADLALLGRAIADRLVEPVRAALIPGFAVVKRAALEAGALGCSISGSGPALFALCDDEPTASRVAAAMQEAFRTAAGLASEAYVGAVNPAGAHRLA